MLHLCLFFRVLLRVDAASGDALATDSEFKEFLEAVAAGEDSRTGGNKTFESNKKATMRVANKARKKLQEVLKDDALGLKEWDFSTYTNSILVEQKIAEAGGLDVAWFGSGHEGRVARNEPGSSLTSRTRVKTLSRETTLALLGRFKSYESVPKIALTMGMGTIFDARCVVALFSGTSRSMALASCVESAGVSHMYPVSKMQKHPNCMFVCDEDATMELRVKTVRYFKGIDRTMAIA